MSHIAAIESHSIHERVRTAIQLVSEARAMDQVPENDEMQLDRIHYVLHIFESALNKVDPYLVPISTLDTTYSYFEHLMSYIHEYKRSKASGQLGAAMQQIDAICSNLRNIYMPWGAEDIEIVKESAVSLRQSLSQHMRYATKESEAYSNTLNKLKDELIELKRRIESEQGRIDGIAAEFQRQFTQNEGTRQETYTKSEQDRENDFNEQYSKLTEMISNIANEMEKNAVLAAEKAQVNSEAQIQKMQSEHMEFMVQAADILGKLTLYQKQGQSILGQISIDSHAAGYKREADKARNAKHIWYGLTGIFFIALILSAWWNSTHIPAEVHWFTLASRWVATLAISAAVTYFARQAAKQDTVERDNRYMELQLATIDPYLEIFEETERKEVKKQLVDRIFTGVRQSKEPEEKAAGISTEDLVKILTTKIGK